MNIKNENGITLITLVVTVIIMSILAGIAISASVGDNRLIDKTREATYKASIREVQEALDAYILLKDKEEIKSGNLNGFTTSELSDVLTLDTGDIYNINLTELDIKGSYGKDGMGQFKATKISDMEYEVFYVDNEGVTYTN